MLEKLKNIEALVFVGGFAFYKQGLKNNYNDVDVVVNDKNFMDGLEWFESNSFYSESGIKSFFILGDFKLDIFYQKDLPDFEIIDGFRCQTIESAKKHYDEMYKKAADIWKPVIENKAKILL